MCSIEKHEWDQMTPMTTARSFFERPNDVSDDSNRFGSLKGRLICFFELMMTPIKIVVLEIVMLFSMAVSALRVISCLVDAVFRPSHWKEFFGAVRQFFEFTVTALILPLKIVELAVRYLLGMTAHPGIALRRINA